MTKVNPTHKEHYVPKCYLKHFTDHTGYLHIYDRKQKKFIKRKPKSICYKEHCYETEWKLQNPTNKQYMLENEIETILQQQESEFAPIIDKIIKICANPENKNALICTTIEKEILQKFIIHMTVRHPLFLENEIRVINNQMAHNDTLDVIKQVIDLVGIGDVEAMCAHAVKKLYLDPSNNNFENYITKGMTKMRQTYMAFFTPNDKKSSFITSSYPVSIDHKFDIGIALSPKLLLVFQRTTKKNQNRLIPIDAEIVKTFNRSIITSNVNEVRYLIAQDKTVLSLMMDNQL